MFPTIPFPHLSKKFSVITIFGQKMFLHVDNQQSRFLWDNLNLRQFINSLIIERYVLWISFHNYKNSFISLMIMLLITTEKDQ